MPSLPPSPSLDMNLFDTLGRKPGTKTATLSDLPDTPSA